MDSKSKTKLFEQSDLVMILLNLAYIPDGVLKNTDFGSDWSYKFKVNMENFKKDFEDTHKKEW